MEIEKMSELETAVHDTNALFEVMLCSLKHYEKEGQCTELAYLVEIISEHFIKIIDFF